MLSCLPLVVRFFSTSSQDVAEIAEWEDEQIERIKEKITERGREEAVMKGKPPAQVLFLRLSVNLHFITRCLHVYMEG